MGAAPSTTKENGNSKGTASQSVVDSEGNGTNITDPIDYYVKFMYPIYFINDPMTETEKSALTNSWRLIIFNNPQEFERVRELHPDSAICNSLPEYFARRFFNRFVEVHPVSGPMFSKTSEKQGRLFMNMITLIVNAEEEDNNKKISGILTALVKSHCAMGIRAVEYSVFGEALFWTMRHILGSSTYNESTHRAWTKLYSKMLTIILPITLRFEASNEQKSNMISSSTINNTSRFKSAAFTNRFTHSVSLDSEASTHTGVYPSHTTTNNNLAPSLKFMPSINSGSAEFY